jgi:hypothetical protein
VVFLEPTAAWRSTVENTKSRLTLLRQYLVDVSSMLGLTLTRRHSTGARKGFMVLCHILCHTIAMYISIFIYRWTRDGPYASVYGDSFANASPSNRTK